MLLDYREKNDAKYDSMIELSQTTATEGKDMVLSSNQVLYSFVLSVLSKNTILYAYKKQDRDLWLHTIKEAIGYSCIFKTYFFKVTFSIFHFHIEILRIWRIC